MKLTILLVACVLLSACSSEEKYVALAPSATATTSATSGKAIPPASTATKRQPSTQYEEPPEEVLREFMFIQYAALKEAGGLPVTVTASGQSGILHAKLYTVAKDRCHLSPIGPPGLFECGVNLMGTLWWDGRREPTKPLSDAKRISVIKDIDNKWVDCTYDNSKKSVCKYGVTP